MDLSRVWQTELNYQLVNDQLFVNTYTRRLLYQKNIYKIGLGNFEIPISLNYNSNSLADDFQDIKIGFSNGWKLNVEQYIVHYEQTVDSIEPIVVDYLYIDANWCIHSFVKYSSCLIDNQLVDYYYGYNDTSLRLYIYEDGKKEVVDTTGNTLFFNSDGKLVKMRSALNDNIEKIIEYSNNHISKIYDAREPNNYISFVYDNDLLRYITNSEDNNILTFMYDENSRLKEIKQQFNGLNRKLVDFDYFSYNKLKEVFDNISYTAFNVDYQITNTETFVQEIKELSYEDKYSSIIEPNMIYCSEGVYCDNALLLLENKHSFYKKTLETSESRLIKDIVFSINSHNVFTVQTLGDSECRYYFDEDGKNISVLENRGNLYHYTLFKTNGWLISENTNNDISINRNAVTVLCSNELCINKNDNDGNNQFNKFMNDFEHDYEVVENPNVEDFYVTFWAKFTENISEKASGKISFVFHYEEDGEEKTRTHSEEFRLLKAQPHHWQFISVPIVLTRDVKDVQEIKISFNNMAENSVISIADVRIGVAPNNRVYIGKSTHLDQVRKIIYNDEFDDQKEIEIDNNDYLVQYDIEETYKSLYLMNKTKYNSGLFDMVYCNGKKVKRVKNIKLKKLLLCSDDFVIDDKGIPNFRVQSCLKIGIDSYNITDQQHRYTPDVQNNRFIHEIKTSYDNVNERNDEAVELFSKRYYIRKSFDGLLYSEQDNYDIITDYVYDAYGNIEHIIKINKDDDAIITNYLYDTSDSKMRKQPQEISDPINNNVFTYNDIYGFVISTVKNGVKEEYEYDSFLDHIKKIKFYDKNGQYVGYNNFIYNYDKLILLSNAASQRYEYYYNKDGEIQEIYTNTRKLLDIEKIKNIVNTTYVVKRKKHDSNNDIVDNDLQLIYNLDGQLTNIINGNENVNIYYQGEMNPYSKNLFEISKYSEYCWKHKESPKVQKPVMYIDPYRNCQVVYYHGSNNEVVGFCDKNMGHDTSNSKLVRKEIVNDKIKYKLFDYNSDLINYKFTFDIEYDCSNSKIKTPDKRIIKTSYFTLNILDSYEYKELSDFEYDYDSFGRLKEKETNSNGLQYKYNYTYNNDCKEMSKDLSVTFFNDYTLEKYDLTETIKYDTINDEETIEIAESGTLCKSDSTGPLFVDIDRKTKYIFDSFKQLSREEDYLNNHTDYVYDQFGNLVEVKVNNNIEKIFTYNYDKLMSYKHNNVQIPIEYDVNANISRIGSKVFKYNSNNLISTFIDTNTNKLTEYKYSYDGILYQKNKHISDDPNSDLEYQINYYMDNGRILAEERVEQNDTKKLFYFYDLEGITTIGYNQEMYHLQKDILGNIKKIIHNGQAICEYHYDAWGNTTISYYDNSIEDYQFIIDNNPFRYRGYYYDVETGLFWLSSRYYSPELCRFISPDDIEYLDLESVNGLNLYCYCLNNPISYCDPTGNSPTEWWEWLLAGVAVAGLVVGSIFTGGLLGGAFLGAAIGAGISLGTQAIQGELNWAQFALDTGVGAITGMVGVSSASKYLAAGIGTFIGGGSNFASQLISGKKIDDINWWKVGVSAAIGGVASFFGGAGAQNSKALNSAPKVSKALNSVNKVLGRMNTGYYSSARYAQAAFTNVANRLGKAVVKQQLMMVIGSMAWYGGSTIATNILMGVW